MFSFFIKYLVVILGLILLVGCKYQVKPDFNNNIKTIAVLPVINVSNDVLEPILLQRSISDSLKKSFYSVEDVKKINLFLKNEYSISLGKQLVDVTTKELAEKLNVDGLVYVYLINAEIVGMSKKNYRFGVKFFNKSGTQIYGKGVAIRNNISKGGLSNLVNLVSNASDELSEDSISTLPMSTAPNNEMPGLNTWINQKKDDYKYQKFINEFSRLYCLHCF